MRARLVLCIGLMLGPVVLHVVRGGWRAEASQAVGGGSPIRAADWPTYNRDLAGTRYSPLTQINATNVATLTPAWTYRLRPEPGRSVPAIDKPASSFELFQQVTPIVVNGVMYLPSGHRVVALEPETGNEIWRYELPEGLASFRGVAWWPGDGTLPARIFFTSLRRLIALRADTGVLDTAFGRGGHIDLEIPYAGVPVLYRNVVLMGSNFFGPGERHIGPHLTTSKGEKGDVHAYDARTGKKVWDFHTIPRPGDVGHDTWEKDSWKDRTGNNVWSFTLTVDEQRGLVYLPVSGPGMNYYGGDRPGDNLFSNATVALDAETGRLRWYFQNIRHEIWDYNLPPAPGLIDIWSNGRTIPALAQVGKSGWMFILNRETGAPVHGIEERPQPKADVPGEWYPATQPTPKKPGPLARVSMTRNDLVTAADTTPAHAEACRALWDKVRFRNDGPYTPWNYRPTGGPPSIVFPGMTGGVNWGGTATDPDLGYVFVNSKDEPSTGWIAPNPRYNEQTKDTEFPYVQQSGGTLSAVARDADGRSLGTLPCFRPPWASLMAVNAATGEFVWRVPLGVNDHMPEGKKNVGSPGYGGPMVTAGGLLFIGATRDQRFRAFESRTGKELWSARFDYNVTAVPITYMGRNGKQYVAVVAAANGQGNNESLHVFTLPPVDQAPSRGTVGTLGEALRTLQEAARNRPPDAAEPSVNGAAVSIDGQSVEMAPWLRGMSARIRRNWFVPAAANIHTGRSAVRFTVSKDGTITSVDVVEPSGVSRFDRQAYMAVVSSNPLEPLPKTYPRNEAVITINFIYPTRQTTAPANTPAPAHNR